MTLIKKMMNKLNYSLLVLIFLFAASCQKEDPTATCSDGILNGDETEIDCGGTCTACERSIEGVFKGYFRATADNNINNVIYETQEGTLTITEQQSSALQFNFFTDAGTTDAEGSYVKNSTFYTLDVTNVYETPGQPLEWELEWPDGGGTFDYVNNELLITLTVDDTKAIGGTNAMYYFEGVQE